MGIDVYARIISHEYAHKRCYEAIQSGLADSDKDRVPDVWEVQVGLNPTRWDSITWSGQGDYSIDRSDSEVFARMYEKGVQGDIDQDWASDGLNKDRPSPANRANRNPQYPDDQIDLSRVEWPNLP